MSSPSDGAITVTVAPHSSSAARLAGGHRPAADDEAGAARDVEGDRVEGRTGAGGSVMEPGRPDHARGDGGEA